MQARLAGGAGGRFELLFPGPVEIREHCLRVHFLVTLARDF